MIGEYVRIVSRYGINKSSAGLVWLKQREERSFPISYVNSSRVANVLCSLEEIMDCEDLLKRDS